MNSLNSLFVQLAETSFRAMFIIAALLLLRPWLRRAIGSQWLCVLWLLVLVRLLLPFSIQSPWSVWNFQSLLQRHEHTLQQAPAAADRVNAVSPEWQARISTVASTETSVASSSQPVAKGASITTNLPAMIWAAGALAGLVGLGWRTFQTRRLAAGSSAVSDPQLLEVFHSIDPELRRNVGLRMNEAVAVPTLAGLRRPQIWLPCTGMEQLTSEELRHVLLHELGHARRRDLLVHWLFLVAQCLHWFNPFIWIAGRLARTDSEMACDAWVLARDDQEDASEYGLTLLKIVQSLRRSVRTPAVVIQMATSKQDLTARVRAIGAFHHIAPWRGVLVATMAVIGLMLVTTTTQTANGQSDAVATSALMNAQASATPVVSPVKADVADASDIPTPSQEDLRVELAATLVEAPQSVWQDLKKQGNSGVELLDEAIPNQPRGSAEPQQGIVNMGVLTEAQRAVFQRALSNAPGVTTVNAEKIRALPGTTSSIAFPQSNGVARALSIAPEIGPDHQTVDLNVTPEWMERKLSASVTLAVSLFAGRSAVVFRAYGNDLSKNSEGSADRSEFLILVKARITDAAGKPVSPKPWPPQVEIRPTFIELTDEAVKNLKLDSVIRAADSTAKESIPVIWNDVQMRTFLQAAEKMKGADLVSAPRVTTKSRQRAVIEIIREFRYPKTWKPNPEKPGAWLAETWEVMNAGVTLEVDPKVNDGEMLTLDLKPQVVEALDYVDIDTGEAAPAHQRKVDRSLEDRIIQTKPESYRFVPGSRNRMVFSERSTHQNVTLKSGQSVVLVLKETADTRPFEDEAPKGHLIAIVTAETVKFSADGTVVAH